MSARSLCLSHVQRCFIEPIWQPEGHPPPPLGSRLRGALAGPRPLRFFAARAGRGNRAEPRGRRGPAEAALAEDRAALSEGRLLPHRPARTSRRRRTARHLVDRRLLRPPAPALLPGAPPGPRPPRKRVVWGKRVSVSL